MEEISLYYSSHTQSYVKGVNTTEIILSKFQVGYFF